MADYDGEVRLGVELDVSDIKDSSRELKKEIKNVFDAASGKESDKAFKSLETSMSKTVQKATELEKELEKIQSTKISNEQNYQEAQQDLITVKQSVKELEAELAKLPEERSDLDQMTNALLRSAREDVQNNLDTAKKDLAQIQSMVDQAKAIRDKDSEKLDERYRKTADSLAEVNNQMRVLLEKSNEYDTTGEEVARTMDREKAAMREMNDASREQASRFSALKKVAGILVADLTKVEGVLKKIASAVIIGGLSKLRSALTGIGNESRRAGGGFGSLLKTLLMYSIGVASLRTLFNKLRNSIVSGLSAMAQMNGGVDAANSSINMLNSSLAYLKNSWAAAFAPIVNYVTPVLIQLVDTIAAVVNKLAMLFAALTGAGSYMRAVKTSGAGGSGGSSGKSAQEKFEEAKKKAQEKYEKELAKVQEQRSKAAAKAEEQQAKAAEKLAKAQEKANGQLQNFDELNVITIQQAEEIDDAYEIPEFEDPILEEPDWDDFKDSGGGALAEMFEEVPVDDWAKALAEKIKAVIADIMEPLKKAWDTMKDYVFDGWKYMTKEIGGLLKSIGRDFIKVWKQAKTVELFKNILGIVGDIEFVIGNIAHNIKEAWDNNFNGLHLLENIRDIFGILVQHVRNVTQYMKEWSRELDFNPLVESLVRLSDSLKPIADFLGGVFEDIMDDAVLPFIKFLVEDGLPNLNTKLEEFNKAVDWEALRGKLDELWPSFEHLAEVIFTGAVEAFGELTQAVANFINSDKFSTFLDNLKKWMDGVTAEDVKKALVGIGTGIGKIVEAIVDFANSDGFQNFLTAVADWWNGLDEGDIGDTLTKIAAGILAFDFAKFVGAGVVQCMEFLALLSMIGGGGGLAGAAGGVSMLADALGVLLTVLTGIADILAFKDLWEMFQLKELQDELPKTADSANGYTKELNLLGKAAAGLYNAFHPDDQKAMEIIVPSDLEKLETMKSEIENVEANMDALGIQTDKTRAQFDMFYGLWADNGYKFEGMTEEQVGMIDDLYTAITKYYDTATSTDDMQFRIGQLSDSYGVLQGSIDDTLSYSESLADGFNQSLSDMKQEADKDYAAIQESGTSAWTELGNGGTLMMNTVAEAFGNMVDNIVLGIQTLKESFNFSLPKISLPSFGGSSLPIPHLAQGAVIPPNSRFLAMLGDQTSGTNVEAPLDTIKQAVAETILQFGGVGGSDNGDIVINIDGREVFRAIRNQDDMYRKSNGHSAFSYEGGL